MFGRYISRLFTYVFFIQKIKRIGFYVNFHINLIFYYSLEFAPDLI